MGNIVKMSGRLKGKMAPRTGASKNHVGRKLPVPRPAGTVSGGGSGGLVGGEQDGQALLDLLEDEAVAAVEQFAFHLRARG